MVDIQPQRQNLLQWEHVGGKAKKYHTAQMWACVLVVRTFADLWLVD